GIAIFLRTGLLHYAGMFEPDGYYYYAVVKATVANHLKIPNPFPLSGFAPHNIVGEAPGLIYISAVAYSIFGVFGVSIIQVMRWMPLVFGLLTIIASYFLVRYLADSRIAGLLAMFFLAVSSGNLARTTVLVYRGDTFVGLFMVLSLIFMLRAFRSAGQPGNKRYLNAGLSAFFLSLGVVFWNGSPFMTMVYMAALALILIDGFVKHDREVLGINLILAEFLFLAYLLEHVYGWLGLARTGLLLIDTSFFAFYVPLLIGCFLAWHSAKNHGRYDILTYRRARVFMVGIALLAIVVAMAVTFNHGVSELTNAIALTNTNVAQAQQASNSTLNTAIGTTTQELQKASFNFLFTSFSMQLFLAPIGVALYLIVRRRADQYLLVPLSYFLVTAVLQAGQIRFNALLSVPMAIFAAYGAYEIGRMVWHVRLDDRMTRTVVAASLCIIIIAVAVFKIGPQINLNALAMSLGYLSNAPFSVNAQAGIIIEMSAILIEVLFAVIAAYLIATAYRGGMELRHVFMGLLAVVVVFGFYSAYATSITSTPADGVNSQFLTAMVWLSQNTPANSTVLTIWPDGSVVEAIGNRQSYTDSVGGENGTKIQLTSQYLFNTTPDSQFLYSIGKPNYIVSRGFWFQEIYGLATEGLVTNVSDFGYQTFTGLNINRTQNGTIYGFYSNQAPYYNVHMVVVNRPDGTRTAVAYMGISGSNRYVELSRIILYDASSFNTSIIYSGSNNTLNYTLLVSYSGNGITGGSLLGPRLVASNLFSLVQMCNYYTCPISDANVSYQAVYINNDTRIFKLTYGK
ncbi:MAG: hypothetical protein KGH58_04400, partial [Candidatus Micrarchaeota archaeon]|nr:hypothetical protein [Candidatus Micrarchaeota archaeon]